MKTSTVEKETGGAAKEYFLNLSPGKMMGLRQITDSSHKFKVLAMDQSNSFRKALRALHEKTGQKGVEPSHQEILGTKLEMVSALGGFASAVLLDVNFGARQSVNSGALPKNAGLIVRLEASRDAGLPSEVERGWSVDQIKKMGASAVKLLIYLDTGDVEGTKVQINFLKQVAADCQRNDILLMVEELTFPRPGEEKGTAGYLSRKVKNILESINLMNPYADILKLEFPGDLKNAAPAQIQENLAKVNEAAQRPWVLLSAGDKFDIFEKYVELAMKAGCSGYMAGRAIFNEYFEQTTPEERSRFLKTTASARMQTLNGLVDRHASSWLDRYQIKFNDLGSRVSPDWYLQGKKMEAMREVKGEY